MMTPEDFSSRRSAFTEAPAMSFPQIKQLQNRESSLPQADGRPLV
jgi:hypothetical protein